MFKTSDILSINNKSLHLKVSRPDEKFLPNEVTALNVRISKYDDMPAEIRLASDRIYSYVDSFPQKEFEAAVWVVTTSNGAKLVTDIYTSFSPFFVSGADLFLIRELNRNRINIEDVVDLQFVHNHPRNIPLLSAGDIFAAIDVSKNTRYPIMKLTSESGIIALARISGTIYTGWWSTSFGLSIVD